MDKKDLQYLAWSDRVSGPVISLIVIAIILIVNTIHSYLIYLDLVVDTGFEYWHLVFLTFPIVFDLGVVIITLNGHKEAAKVYAFFVFFIQMYYFLTETEIQGTWYFMLASYALIFIWSAGVSGLLYYFTEAFATRIERKEYEQRLSDREKGRKAKESEAERKLSRAESQLAEAKKKLSALEATRKENEDMRKALLSGAENSKKWAEDVNQLEAVIYAGITRVSQLDSFSNDPENLKRNIRNYNKQIDDPAISLEKRGELEFKIRLTQYLINSLKKQSAS